MAIIGVVMTKRILKIELARAYSPPAADDSYRVLVDRLWPRGLSKENAKLDLWMKNSPLGEFAGVGGW